jgi:aldehyde:ferredoxin oxidoreductase
MPEDEALVIGWHGRYLRVDLSRGASEIVPLGEEELRRYPGGVGLGSWILTCEFPAGGDPLGESTALVFASAPLVGTAITTTAKCAVVGKSPLTNRLCDALISSRFALILKRAGVDAIVLRGRAEHPVVAWVEGAKGAGGDPVVSIERADGLWGISARDAEAWMKGRDGGGWQACAIGVAGERGVRFATISHDGRHAGRGGLGAVMGSMRVKGLAVRGDCLAKMADPSRVRRLAEELSARSLGPETEKYRVLGTMANLLVLNRLEALPTRNFQAGSFAGAEALAGERLVPLRERARSGCASCTIGCEHLLDTGDGRGVRMEYESMFALGPLCGIDDASAVIRAVQRCDELGLDTISTGGTIAWAMECGERGLLDGSEWSRVALRFGSSAGMLQAVEQIGRREGIGVLLGEGSRRAAERIGSSASELAMHVKGMELPGYDPRVLHALGLGLAVSTRGADHNRSGAYEADLTGLVDRFGSGPELARAVVEFENRAAVFDSLIVCKFLRGVFEDWALECGAMLEAVTGWRCDAGAMREMGERVVLLRRWFNERAGWTRAEDSLPGRLLRGEREARGVESPGLSRVELNQMIDAYYELRGCDSQGCVRGERLEELGVDRGQSSDAGRG